MKKCVYLLAVVLTFISCGSKQKVDSKLQLNNIWVATYLNNEELSLKEETNRPQLEIKVVEKKISGKGVCNSFFGDIKIVTNKKLEFNNNIGSTKMMCKNMTLEDRFFKVLLATKTYKIKDNSLSFFNDKNDEIVRFKKID